MASAAEKAVAKALAALCADKIDGVKNKIDAANTAAAAEDFAAAKTAIAQAIARNGRIAVFLANAQEAIESCTL